MSNAISPAGSRPIRLLGRSFIAFVLAPVLPIARWLDDLDAWAKTSPGFFNGRPTILDLSGAALDKDELRQLLADLTGRGVAIVGVEGADLDQLGPGLPPLLAGGRPVAVDPAQAEKRPKAGAKGAPGAKPEKRSLVLTAPIRSGQSVSFPYGDVTVVGSIGSGSELIASGSIHVYGAIRGKALAGCNGDAEARIFCTRNEAELLAIDGYYCTPDGLDEKLRGRPIQVWLDHCTLRVEALD